MKNDKETDKKYKYNTNAKTAERIAELIGDTPSGTIAKDLGLTRQTISNFVNGRYKPVGDNLEKLADYFNVSTDYILGRTDVKSPDTKIQGVCEYLGLTEQAVNILAELSKHHSNLSDFIIKHLTAIINEITLLSAQSDQIFAIKAESPSAISDEYERLMIDAVRYRATITFNKVLDDYDMRIAKAEEYEDSKKRGRKLQKELVENHKEELLNKIKKGEIKIGSDRKEKE